MDDFLKRLEKEVLVCDGAMGTMLNVGNGGCCRELLNLAEPERVRAVHQAYIDAGAQIIETNTFCAHEKALKKFNLEDKVIEINRAGVEIARSVAGNNVYVAGSVGPGGNHASFGVYLRQVKALIDAGVDLILVETMSYVDEAVSAIHAAKSVKKEIPVVVQVACNKNFATRGGIDAETFIRIVSSEGADVVGLNCFIGPKDMLPLLENIRHWTVRPLSVQPNIGEVSFSAQEFYARADTFERYSKKFVDAGAKIIGGCCGTTPLQIKSIAKAVAMHSPKKQRISIKPIIKSEIVCLPRLERMLVENKPFPIVEIDPPFVGESPASAVAFANNLYDSANNNIVFTVADNPGAVPRMNNIAFASLLRQKMRLAEIVLHMACRDLTAINAESIISGAEAIGARNILAVTGDPPAAGDYDMSTAVNNFQSISLLRLLSGRNAGRNFLGEQLNERSHLYLGCAFDCGKFASEKLKLQTKYLAGANFALTQIISDVKTMRGLADFYAQAKQESFKEHNFYIVPGIYLFKSVANMEYMRDNMRIKIAPETIELMRSQPTADAQRECGYALAKELIVEAKKYFPAVYIIPSSKKPELIIPLLKETSLI